MGQDVYHVSFPGLGIENIEVNRVAVTVGGFSIYWYGVIIAVGFLLAFIYAMKSLKRYEIKQEPFIDCVLAGLIFGIIGARLYFVIFSWDNYKDNLASIFDIHSGGLAIYGGIIGAMGAACVAARIVKVNIPAMLDIGAIGFLIGQGLGRWGNFINQEAFGTPTDLPWGMVSENTQGIAVHPCFLYESLWCIIGFFLLLFLSHKWRKFYGQMFLLYLIWYGSERMIVEGLRTDSLMTPFLGLRVSQILSAILVVVGTVLLIIGLKKANNYPVFVIGYNSGKDEENAVEVSDNSSKTEENAVEVNDNSSKTEEKKDVEVSAETDGKQEEDS